MINYYNEIEHLIKRKEVNKRARALRDNTETIQTYWEIGKLIVEAQGGKSRAKYGNELIKKWSLTLTKLYGKGYNTSNLKRYRQFFLIFPKGAPLEHQLSWTHYKTVLAIKDENERNYYLNLCISNNLSKNKLIAQIKSKAYERLLDPPSKIKLLTNNDNNPYNLKEHLKNPIIIKLSKEDKILKESDLQLKILSELQDFFFELGEGFTFVGSEYKIKYGSKYYYIDLLLFNFNLNAFVVVELKTRELKKEDKAQIEFYMHLIDTTLKKSFHYPTIGLIVSKYQNRYIVSFVSSSSIIPITYKLVHN